MPPVPYWSYATVIINHKLYKVHCTIVQQGWFIDLATMHTSGPHFSGFSEPTVIYTTSIIKITYRYMSKLCTLVRLLHE